MSVAGATGLGLLRRGAVSGAGAAGIGVGVTAAVAFGQVFLECAFCLTTGVDGACLDGEVVFCDGCCGGR